MALERIGISGAVTSASIRRTFDGTSHKTLEWSLSKGSSQRESYLKRFDGMKNVCECRRGRWSYSGGIGVVNVVIAAVEHIQEFG